MLPDLINGSFGMIAALFIFLNIRQIYKDKEAKGVYLPTMVFFAACGYWNIFYYPHLGQWFSFAGGLAIALLNSVYVGMLIYYNKKKESYSNK